MEKDADLRLSLFDFCIVGEIVEDIAGIMFAKISFLNPGCRIETRFSKGLLMTLILFYS